MKTNKKGDSEKGFPLFSKEKKTEYKDVKKIGSVPSGYSKGDVLFIKDNKIFIAKR